MEAFNAILKTLLAIIGIVYEIRFLLGNKSDSKTLWYGIAGIMFFIFFYN